MPTDPDGNIAVLVLTDGRGPYLAATLAAFEANATGPIVHRVIHDDSGEPNYTAWLEDTFPTYTVVTPGLPAGTKAGFAGAIRSAWSHVAELTGYGYVWHLEEDFLLERPLDLAALADILDRHPYLAQLALRRQAWPPYPGEGGDVGFAEKHADGMVEVLDELGRTWLSHRLLFTTNPSLYRRQLIKVGWPEGAKSEDRFTERLLEGGLPWGIAPADVRFAFYGSMTSGRAWVRHIGELRTGHTY